MNKLAHLSVIYHENEIQLEMAKNCWKSFKGLEKLAIINRKYEGKYPEDVQYINNTENCLAKAWNMGLKHLFKRYEYVLVTNLDLLCPGKNFLDAAANFVENYPDAGVWGFTPTNNIFPDMDKNLPVVPIQHGDGSFSMYIISRNCFTETGGFYEQYKPAYFEDNDFLETLWKSGYTPLRHTGLTYYHVVQGSLKYGKDTQKAYPVFMQKNLQLFVSRWGKIPSHLPKDIKFS